MELNKIIDRAMQVRQQYAEWETARYGRTWTTEEIALGFVGDMGDLAKLILAKEGVRNIPETDAKLAHELADCLWSIIVLAQHSNIDLEQAFLQTMDEIETHLKNHST